MCHGIGKAKMLKAVQTEKCSLSLLGDVNADMKGVTKQATAFMCRCYNVPNAATMTEARIKVWLTKTGRKSASKVPKLYSLPPTTEVFEENVKRAHFQCAIWRRALQEPPNLDPTQYMDGLEMTEKSPFNQSCFLPQNRQLQIISLNWFAALVHQRVHAEQVDVDV